MGGHSEDNESSLSPDTLIHKKGAKVAVGIMEKKNSHRPDVTILFCLFHFHDYKPGGHVSPKEIGLLTTGNVSGRYVYYLSNCYDRTSNRNTLWDEGFLLAHSLAAVPHCGGEGKIDDRSSTVCNGRTLQWQIISP